MIKLTLPTQFPISSPYKQKSKVWDWHFDEEKKLWVNMKDKDGWGYHKGYDFACPAYSPIAAGVKGQVVKAGWQDDRKPPNDIGFGLRIIQLFEHEGKKYLLYYGHLARIHTQKEKFPNVGEVIAQSGNSGHSTGPHLHMEVRDFATLQPQEIEWITKK